MPETTEELYRELERLARKKRWRGKHARRAYELICKIAVVSGFEGESYHQYQAGLEVIARGDPERATWIIVRQAVLTGGIATYQRACGVLYAMNTPEGFAGIRALAEQGNALDRSAAQQFLDDRWPP